MKEYEYSQAFFKFSCNFGNDSYPEITTSVKSTSNEKSNGENKESKTESIEVQKSSPSITQ